MRSHKSWPFTAKVIIFLGYVGNIRNVIAFVSNDDVLAGVVGVLGLVIWWYVYKFKLLALLALNVLVMISMLMMVFKMMAGLPLMNGLIAIGVQLGFVIYFDNMALDGMFEL
jgi:hypothetical protein